LQSLSEPVRTRLRSTHILTSLPQVVSQLVQNALDASASHIDIGVDCQEWECWVKDDGNGIARSGLDALSKSYEAGRYNTSKAHTLGSLEEISTFGFRGEALASAADVSCLEISSRTAISRQTWSIITKNGRCLYNGPAARWQMEHSGTVVHLRDIFHNLPIRRNSHSRPSKTIEIICRDIETLALVFLECHSPLTPYDNSQKTVLALIECYIYRRFVNVHLTYILFLTNEIPDIVHPVSLSSHQR
ncbi:histidine kinase-like ATPase, partial [Russula vinacea]